MSQKRLSRARAREIFGSMPNTKVDWMRWPGVLKVPFVIEFPLDGLSFKTFLKFKKKSTRILKPTRPSTSQSLGHKHTTYTLEVSDDLLYEHGLDIELVLIREAIEKKSVIEHGLLVTCSIDRGIKHRVNLVTILIDEIPPDV